MDMYLRIKRFKTTVFLECTPKDKIEDLRKKLSVILKEDIAKIRLVGEDSVQLPDQKTVTELGFANDAVVFMVFPLEGGLGWEKVNIPPPEVFEEEEEDGDEGDN